MELRIEQQIEKLLRRAEYEYDPSVKSWAAWINSCPGVYAQGRNVEETREELVSTLEDFLIFQYQDSQKIPLTLRVHAKTNQS